MYTFIVFMNFKTLKYFHCWSEIYMHIIWGWWHGELMQLLEILWMSFAGWGKWRFWLVWKFLFFFQTVWLQPWPYTTRPKLFQCRIFRWKWRQVRSLRNRIFLSINHPRFILKDREDFFTSAQRSHIVWQILLRTSYDESHPDKVIWKKKEKNL